MPAAPGLFDFPATLLPVAFAGQRLLGPELLARLQIEGVPLDLLNDVLLLDFSFEAAKGVFKRFALLKLYFSQTTTPPNSTKIPVRSFGFFVRDPTIGDCLALTQKFPALHTEGTDIIGG